MDSLPPDPYVALGVPKDADLAQIRSAHRKLILKCHPDKVQDPQLKAVKQDEFQTVQQAYELLSDDKKRIGYDEKVKLFELRKEMSRGNPTARSNPFEYEVRSAEPRSSPTSYTRPSPKVYSQPPPRSYEDLYEEPLRAAPRKSSSYEEKKRSSLREDDSVRDRRRYDEDERVRSRVDRKSEKSVHSDKKKSRDKERRRGTEEKTRRTTTAYVEDDSEDEYRASKKSSRHRMEDEIRQREEESRAAELARKSQRDRERERERPAIKSTALDPKWTDHNTYASQYIQTSRSKADPETHHPGMPRRADTFTASSIHYNVRNATPQQFEDEEVVRRSSARGQTRRSSETPVPRASSRDKSKTSRRSPPMNSHDAYIVEPPSPPPVMKKPSLQSHSSAPPILPTFSRKEPSRSKTQEYPIRSDKAPSLPRAQTFNVGGERGREQRGSRLRQQVPVESDSDSDSPVFSPARYSHSPPRRTAEPVRYIIDHGKSIPIKSRTGDHRSELRNSDNDPYIRERSESPRSGGRHPSERPSMPRQSSERPRAMPTRSQSQAYYPPESIKHADPIILTARPKMMPRESSSHRTIPARTGGGGGYFGEIKYGPSYGPENVIYANHPPVGGSPPETWRRGSDPNQHRGYEQYSRGGREVYA